MGSMGAASDKSERILKRLSKSLAKCSKEAAAYAMCVETALPNVRAAACSLIVVGIPFICAEWVSVLFFAAICGAVTQRQ